MKIVIDIPEEDYIRLKEHGMFGRVDVFKNAVRDAVVLPKGHGRLIDADTYRKEMLDSREFDFFKRLDMQPTIIEADKAESEK